MKILEILTVVYPANEDQQIPKIPNKTHQILFQDGWDYRNTVNENGYVRWNHYGNGFTINKEKENVCLRGWEDSLDYVIRLGEIDFDKITDFFNSPESPLVGVNSQKKFIGDFNQEDLDKMNEVLRSDKEVKFKKVDDCLRLNGSIVWILDVVEYPHSHITPSYLSRYIFENFSFTKPKKVVMTMESIPGKFVTEELRTWRLL